MAYPHQIDIKTDKTAATFRKQNYWTTQSNSELEPWYNWGLRKVNSNIRPEDQRIQEKKLPQKRKNSDFREYLLTSTLHGLRYIGEKKITYFERFFWLTAFCCSVVGASVFIWNVYGKWTMSPMIVTINSENMPIQGLPFPALTICNVNQAKKSVASRYRKSGSYVDKKILESLCSTLDDSEIFADDIAESANWDHTRSFLINVTQPCSEMLATCFWDSTEMNCLDLFNAQLTDEGLCCTFNVVHREKLFRNPRDLNDLNLTFPSPAVDWTPEKGYPDDAPDDGFPWRPKGVGTHHGLTLALDANLAEYYCASTYSPGFKILLHNPTETPKIANLAELYAPGIEARVAITPTILDAQPSLESIDIKKRHCFFSSEKELIFFRTYTLNNCEMECQAQTMLEKCTCVHYYMPKNKSTRICGKADAVCYNNLRIAKGINGGWKKCDECLPGCNEINFVEKISTAPLNLQLVSSLSKQLINKTPEYIVKNMLIVHFYFEERTFTRFTKGEIFGLTEFLSNTGGLLGLCMGFSVMSAVELLYFVTLRAFCLAQRRHASQPFTQ